jgi:hypothetical protein
VDAHDAVGDRGDGAFVARLGGELDLLDAGLDQFADFGGVEIWLARVGLVDDLVGLAARLRAAGR